MPLAHQPEPEEEKYPLGAPIREPEPAQWTAIAGRPNWWRDRKGQEKYIEPEKPEFPPIVFYQDPEFPPHLWSGM